MSSTTTLMDRLLEQSSTSECQEHTLEQGHWALDDVHNKFLGKFDAVVTEIAQEWGNPEFTGNTEQDNDGKNPIPTWVTGSRKGEVASKIIRITYWRREGGMCYVLLRVELDAKDRPKYYNIVIGSRRRIKRDTSAVEKLRHTDTSLLGWIKRKISSGS